jgi:hypothetical protein
VGVQVDQARRDELAAGIEHAAGALGRNAGLHRLDHAEADADVALAGEVLARVEHVGVAHQQVEPVVRAHCGLRQGRGRAQARSGSEQQLPALDRRCLLVALRAAAGRTPLGPV